jgi:hypothetical protein
MESQQAVDQIEEECQLLVKQKKSSQNAPK